jgi:hypothetical protein
MLGAGLLEQLARGDIAHVQHVEQATSELEQAAENDVGQPGAGDSPHEQPDVRHDEAKAVGDGVADRVKDRAIRPAELDKGRPPARAVELRRDVDEAEAGRGLRRGAGEPVE